MSGLACVFMFRRILYEFVLPKYLLPQQSLVFLTASCVDLLNNMISASQSQQKAFTAKPCESWYHYKQTPGLCVHTSCLHCLSEITMNLIRPISALLYRGPTTVELLHIL